MISVDDAVREISNGRIIIYPTDTVWGIGCDAFNQDAESLCAQKPDVEPRATMHISEMLAIISKLIDSGYAYISQNHVLFSVSSMKDYGKLSGRSLDELIDGARVEIGEYKKNPADFILWKPAQKDEPGWNSEFGRGRPGWHIECSAMSAKYLGEQFLSLIHI